MKKAICPLILIIVAAVAAALGFELWIAKRTASPPTADTIHSVAKIELDLARTAWVNSCGASNPDVLGNMETLKGVNVNSLTRNQRELLQEVAWRLAGADAGYSTLFFANHLPMADYSERAIIDAAARSAAAPGARPAARVLKDIYVALPSIYSEPMNCSNDHAG